jgi:23S rRNA (cytosine1962-C5)-methyltransferase
LSDAVEGLRRALSGKRELLSGTVAGTDCFRLCAGAEDGCDGLIVDRFGSLVVATAYGAAESGRGPRLLAELRSWFPSFDIVVKSRTGTGEADAFAVERSAAPGDEPLIATEQGLNPAHDFGLYLDAAKARLYVRGLSRDRNVLNLFSYAGAFGVAAAAGAAASVTNVDPNKDYLAWSLRNARLNAVNMRVLPDTAQAFLRKHLRRLERSAQTVSFDLVIIDPPAFGVGRGNERLLRLLWPELFAAVRVMAPRDVVLMCNDKYYRSRRSFPDVVNDELGARYRFTRLGTHLTVDDVADPKGPYLRWKASVEDSHYVEPIVLAGTLS